MANYNFGQGYSPPDRKQNLHGYSGHGASHHVTPLNEIQPPQPYAYGAYGGHEVQTPYPQGQLYNPNFPPETRFPPQGRGGGPDTRMVERPNSSRQERGKREGGRDFKPFWKDKHLTTDEERLKYLGHCRKWAREEDESLIISRIRQAPEPLESLLNCKNIDTKIMQHLLEVLTCDNLLEPPHSEKQTTLNIFAKVLDSEFIKSVYNLSNYICDVYDSFEGQMEMGYRNNDFVRLKNIYQLLNHLSTIHQSEIDTLWPLIRSLSEKRRDDFPVPIPEDLNYDISHLYKRCKEIRDKKTESKKIRAQNKQFEDDAGTDYGCPYTQMEILPSKDEIIKPDSTKLRALLTTSKYPTAELYLDTHFKLLREDMIRPLRQGIQNFLKDQKENVRKELFMYENVRIVDMDCDPKQGLLYRVTFQVCNVKDPSKIRWDRAQRLKFGTLLCVLTYGTDGKPSFERPLWAVVAHRDEKVLTDRMQISIKFKTGFQPEFEFNQFYFVIESRQVYYEAYFHTLSVIQNMTPETLPLKEVILGISTVCSPPNYISPDTVLLFPNIFPSTPALPALGRWPPNSDILDPSQFKALRAILTREVALIQGPPGTGKTYVGARALQVMLATRQNTLNTVPKLKSLQINDALGMGNVMDDLMRDVHFDKGLFRGLCKYPIVIVTYTNHALDQFLEYILEYETNIIRIGTRIDREELNEKTLPKVAKKLFEDKANIPQEIKKLRWSTYDLQKELKDKQGVIREASKQLGSNSLSKEDFGKYLNTAQYTSLFGATQDGFRMVNNKKQSVIEMWLGHPINNNNNTPSNSVATQPEKSQGGRRGKKKDKHRSNTVRTANKYDLLQDVISDEDEIEPNRYEKQAKVLQDLNLVPQPPPRTQFNMYSLPVTGQFGSNYTQQPMGLYDNFSQPMFPPQDLINFNNFPTQNTLVRPVSPSSISYSDVTDIMSIASRDTGFREDNPFDLESEDNYLHHDSDDEDAVDAPFQSFYEELRDFSGLSVEEARMLYTDTTQANVIEPDRILQHNDLWILSLQERSALYDYLLEKKKQELNQILVGISTDYSNILKELQHKQRQVDVYVLKQAAIVGMTTTGAARNSELLAELHPRILFVEEAAEVLEAHILACLSQHVEHLILIGDHQQLRPSNAVYELSKKYNLEISLFERLITRGVDHVTLSTQHRMRPEISALIKPIYPQLEDYPDVHNYPPVRGVLHNIFFIDHTHDEDHLIQDSTSRTNKHEALFVAHFTKYLLKQGYDGKDITILTFYMGQKFKILDYMRKVGSHGQGVRCTTVDRYQGEENTIIIFSVVRSNLENNIGYCRVDNRVCVALSRAKHGFFIIGNSRCLSRARSDTHLWSKVLGLFRGKLSNKLPLCCKNHPTTITAVEKPEDFQLVKNGGCMVPCDKRLSCGHQCPQQCHPDGHDEVKCQKECIRIHEPCKHPCVDANGRRKRCYEECEDCLFQVEKELGTCLHKQMMACSTKPEHHHCRRPCQLFLPCNHQCPSRCGEDCGDSLCTVMVTVKLYCGHEQTLRCFESGELLRVECNAKCNKELECGDLCPGSCGECIQGKKHVSCKRRCDNPLTCGHPCKERCHKPRICPPCRKGCINKCPHTQCGFACGEKCVPCVERCIWVCRHSRCKRRCYEPCDKERCNYDCEKLLPCRHQCMGLCGEPCPMVCKICSPEDENFDVFFGTEDEDDARFLTLVDCGHIFEVTGLDQWMDVQLGGRENTGRIQLPFCPKCNEPIRKNLRYGKIVKAALNDLEEVKMKIIDNMRGNITKSCHEILDKMQTNFVQFNSAQSEIVQNILKCTSIASQCEHQKLYIIFDLLKIFADLYETPHNVWMTSKIHKIFTAYIAKNIDVLLGDRKYRQLDDDIMAELGNLSRKCVLSSLFGAISPVVNDQCDRIVFDSLYTRFQNDIQYTNTGLIHDCELFLANVTSKYKYKPLTEQERIDIALAVDVNRSGWYRCENGHLYGIGECGGAIMESRCNECGARIGGTGHRVQDNNMYAGPDMGGNTVPSWPGQPGWP